MKAVWENVLEDIKDSIQDPESRAVLKDIMFTAMIKNKNKLPSSAVNKSLGEGVEKYKTKIDTGRGTTVSAYNLHWNDWKEDNIQKEYPDPDDPTKKLTQHKYWQKHVWPKINETEKKKWDAKAKEMREDLKKNGGGTKKKRQVSKSGFQLFLEKQKSLMDKDQEFTHPDDGSQLKLHHFLLYIWSNHIKDNEDLKKPFDEMAKEIKESDDGIYDIATLPYIDPIKLESGDLDGIELIED